MIFQVRIMKCIMLNCTLKIEYVQSLIMLDDGSDLLELVRTKGLTFAYFVDVFTSCILVLILLIVCCILLLKTDIF